MSGQTGEILLADGEVDAMRRARIRERRSAFAVGTLALALLVGGLVVIEPWRAPDRTERLNTSPVATPLWDLTQVPEEQQWGRVWSVANGASVLRPMWLPPAANGYATGFSVGGGTGGLNGYRFWYYANETHPTGSVVRSIEFMAARDGLPLGFTALDSPPEVTMVSGHSAELVGTDRVPLWELSWSDLGYQYGVQVFGYTRDETMRIANGLARVIDESGRVAP